MRGSRLLSWLILLLALPHSVFAQDGVKRFVPVVELPASERRIALVLGNAAYPSRELKNPVNDAEAMAKTLHDLGFEVLLGTDLKRKAMLNLIHEWGRKLSGVQIALFYYSGHGMQAKGVNYLIPLDADPHSEDEVADDMVDAGKVLEQLTEGEKSRASASIIILDACRDNPFGRSFKSESKGLAKMDAPPYALIAYATALGKTASDNPKGKNGLYTQELLKQIVKPGLKIGDVFDETASAVLQASGGEQLPHLDSNVLPKIYLKAGASAPVVPGGNVVPGDTQAYIVVTSEPTGATVVVDKQIVGKTPAKVAIDLNLEDKKTVQVGLLLEGYVSAKFTATLEAGKETMVAAGALKPIKKMDKEEIPNGGVNTGGKLALRKNPKDEAEMALIPAGEFTMGSTVAEIDAVLAADNRLKREWFVGEIGQHKVSLSDYYIYKTPVTVAQYLKFCNATGHARPPAPDFNPNWSKTDHPIVNVSWNDAQAYCAWASKDSGLTITLPTEAQWEKAARGPEGFTFPWGNTWDASKCANSVGSKLSGTMRVDRFAANGYGLFDMGGNVCQWCSDWYDEKYYANSPTQDPSGPASSPNNCRALRGGAWNDDNGAYFRCAKRLRLAPGVRDLGSGFRCVARADFH